MQVSSSTGKISKVSNSKQAVPFGVLLNARHVPLCVETGELVGYGTKGPHYVESYVGDETVYPKQAKNAQALRNAASVHDRYADSLTFYPDRLLDLLDAGVHTVAVRILRRLCESLTGRNVWFGSLTDVRVAMDVPERSFTRAVAELSAARLVVVRKLGQGKRTQVEVHPWYAFKGDRQLQQQYLSGWLRQQIAMP